MSQINVVSATQRIVVNPTSSGVQVINTGPPGPPGPPGESGEDPTGYIATEEETLLGESNSTLISPLRLQQKFDAFGETPYIGAFATVDAPTAASQDIGHYYFDLSVGVPYWSNGTSWVGGGTGSGGGPPDPATGATAGSPGNFTPPGSSIPANYAQLVSWDPTANPATLWSVGTHILLGDATHAYWDGDSWEVGDAEPAPLSVGLTATPTSLFEPWIGLTEATDISWRNSSNVEIGTGTTPSFTVPANGIINMVVEDGAAVEFMNFGFDNTQDQSSLDSLAASYNWDPTTLTGVTTDLTDVPNLKYFMAADTPLTGPLVFGGHPTLEYVECYHAHVESSDLTGCDSLVRLCYETNDLEELDLTPVRLTLRDLRCADQGGASPLDLSCTGDLPLLNHYCTQGNNGGSDVPLSQMPHIREWWVWDKGLTTPPGGDYPSSPYLRSMISQNNPFTPATVDEMLQTLAEVAWAITDPVIGQLNYNAAWNHSSGITATAAANEARAFLRSRSWDFPHLTLVGDLTSAGIWPAHTKGGTADGWTGLGLPEPVAVYNDLLTFSWGGYRRIQRSAPDGSSIANPTFTVTAPRESFLGGLWGIYCRAGLDGNNGAKALINGVTGALSGLGLSNTAFGGNGTVTNLSPVPAGWTNPGDHTVQMRVVGNQITLALDGTDCYRATPSPSGGAYSGYYFGMCGDASYLSRRWSDYTFV